MRETFPPVTMRVTLSPAAMSESMEERDHRCGWQVRKSLIYIAISHKINTWDTPSVE
jgi:hypothetical protein